MNEPERSATFERQFLELVAKRAAVWDQSLDFKRAVDAVRQRLEKGQSVYGPGSFMGADRHEVDEEGADLVAWSMLFAQRSLAEGEMGDLEDYVYIAAAGVQAWIAAQRIRERRVSAPAPA